MYWVPSSFESSWSVKQIIHCYWVDLSKLSISAISRWDTASHFRASSLYEWLHRLYVESLGLWGLVWIFLGKYSKGRPSSYIFWWVLVDCISKFRRPCRSDCLGRICGQKHWVNQSHGFSFYCLSILYYSKAVRLFAGSKLSQKLRPCSAVHFSVSWLPHRYYT